MFNSDYSKVRGNVLSHSRTTELLTQIIPTSPITPGLNSSRGSLSPTFIPIHDPPKMRLSHKKPLFALKRT